MSVGVLLWAGAWGTWLYLWGLAVAVLFAFVHALIIFALLRR